MSKEKKPFETFEVTREIHICGCWNSCDCEPTSAVKYGVKFEENGRLKNREFWSEQARQNFIKENNFENI